MLKQFLPFAKKYRLYTVLSPVFVTLETIMEVLIPFSMTKIIDIGMQGGDIPYIVKQGLFMSALALLSLLFGALSGKYSAVAASGFAKELRSALFGKALDFSFANIDKFNTASLVTRITTDVTAVQNSFMMIIRVLFRAPIMLISGTIMAATINPELSLVFLISLPFLAIALIFISTKAFPLFKRMLAKYDKMNGIVQENLSAIRVVKSFVRENYEKTHFSDSVDDVRSAQIKAEKLLIMNMPIMQFSMYATIVAIVWFGGNKILAGTMQTGALIGYISYVSQILFSLLMISMIFINLVFSRASMSRIAEVLNEKVDIDDTESSFEVEDGSIEFKNVSFSYFKDENNVTLSDINLKIESGETVGIIGGTGSSKTTLVQLIPRLYDVLSGSICVGGRDVREYSLENLRQAVAMVLQKNELFTGTIKENLLWGNPLATDEEIEAACRDAEAHDFIMSFPDGYDTVLGQGGVNVSGGQKQRLCIARALLKAPKIIILDDSTSAVDTATDKKIREALKKNLVGTTTIIIAQRVASVCDADKIIVMDDGKINGIGTHEELLKTNEIYQDVYNSQQQGIA